MSALIRVSEICARASGFRDETNIDSRPLTIISGSRHSVWRDRRWTRSVQLCRPQLVLQLMGEQFAVATRFVPNSARKVRTPEDLPPALERIAMCAERSSHAWLAWTMESRIWFLVAERAKLSGPAGRTPAIRMCFYDADGRPAASGIWVVDATRRWTLVSPGWQ